MKPKFLIYIIDDEPFNLLLISRKLKHAFNCTTYLFKNIPEAIHAIRKIRPDLILCDYRFADDSSNKLMGDFMIHWMKGKQFKTPLLIYSSVQNLELSIKMIRNGATEFILRDENFLDKLIQSVNSHLVKIRANPGRLIGGLKTLISIMATSGILSYFQEQRQVLTFRLSTLLLAAGTGLLFLKDPIQRITDW